MIFSPDDSQAADLTLPLDVTGWYAICLGLWNAGSRIRVRLGSDRGWLPFRQTTDPAKLFYDVHPIEEVLFRIADLRNEHLVISQIPQRPAGLAYVRLSPLTGEEVAAAKADRADRSHRRLTASCDGFSFLAYGDVRSREDVREQTEVFRDTDFDTLVLQMGTADGVNYESGVGHPLWSASPPYPGRPYRNYAESCRALNAQGINPTRTLIEGAHDAGLAVHVASRVAAWEMIGSTCGLLNSPFYRQHPEWRCREPNGVDFPRMSFAIPEVRAHVIDVLREALRFGADGVNILYARGVPLVLFEDAFCDQFRRRYGQDPRPLGSQDERVHQVRAEILTQFMQETRAMLDEEGEHRGRRLALSAFTLWDEPTNLRYGIDVRRWATEGLVDMVLPYKPAGDDLAGYPYDLAFYHSVCEPKGIPVRPTFTAWALPCRVGVAQAVLEAALSQYEHGATGFTFWDAHSRADVAFMWNAFTRLGHREELLARIKAGAAGPQCTRFHRIDGALMDGDDGPNWGF
jgi:hypothetical protein